MRIGLVGTGHVGLVAGTGFAENGHQVICADRNEERIQALQQGQLPFHEPGLKDLVTRNVQEERLSFTTDTAEAVEGALLVFLCVGTPQGQDGAADLSQVLAAAESVGDALTDYTVIVNKSTCPVGTTDRIRETIRDRTAQSFDVVANPEFFKGGNAVDDFMRPDRIVVGTEDVRVLEIMKELYAPFLRTGKPFISMGARSAELSKYAVNAMLAVRISLINELANLAQAYDCDINEIRQAIMSDGRIGPGYLFPGIGFGGSCLPKDLIALDYLAKDRNLETSVIAGATATNRGQVQTFIEHILQYYNGDVQGKTLALWGASYKPRTDDIRNAPALAIVDTLLNAGALIQIYDPVAGPALFSRYGESVRVSSKMYEAVESAHGLVIATEWREFHNPDFKRMGELLNEKVVFDGRNLYERKALEGYGFRYFSVGRPPCDAKRGPRL